jgi:hypothetical protein
VTIIEKLRSFFQRIKTQGLVKEAANLKGAVEIFLGSYLQFQPKTSYFTQRKKINIKTTSSKI